MRKRRVQKPKMPSQPTYSHIMSMKKMHGGEKRRGSCPPPTRPANKQAKQTNEQGRSTTKGKPTNDQTTKTIRENKRYTSTNHLECRHLVLVQILLFEHHLERRNELRRHHQHITKNWIRGVRRVVRLRAGERRTAHTGESVSHQT